MSYSSFSYSAEDIRLDDGHILRARLQTADGNWNDSEIDLNQCIGNDNGNFAWDGVNFSDSAQDITFSIEGESNVAVLRATLMDADGNPQYRDINLDERISNQDGNFYFQ
ncbi:hypothetical protein ACJQWK_09553 [Exserohilum turcicum]